MCRGTLLEEHCYTACTERTDFSFSHDSCQRISPGLFPSDSPHPPVASAEPSPLCVSLTPSAMAGPKPVVLTGPSGAGKSTLLKKLMKEFDNVFGFSVSRKCAQLAFAVQARVQLTRLQELSEDGLHVCLKLLEQVNPENTTLSYSDHLSRY